MRWLALPIVAAVAGLVVLALPSDRHDGERPVGVTLEEFTVRADRQAVPAGKVRFETRNEGALEHELLILRTDLAADKLPLGLEGPALEVAGELVLGAPHEHSHGDRPDRPTEHIAPGRTRLATVALSPGKYVLLCTLPGHYEAGQSAALLVR